MFHHEVDFPDDVELPTYVFVYGTLKRGRGNHHLLKSSTYIGEDKTTPNHVMWSCGCPFVYVASEADNPDLVGSVKGELYVVDDHRVMDSLDRLEGHPTFYNRNKIVLQSGRHAWIYYYPRYNADRNHNYFVVPNEDNELVY